MNTILITGATGFLGGAVLMHLLQAPPPDTRLLLLVRGRDRRDGLERVRDVLQRYAASKSSLASLREEHILCGDLSDLDVFAHDERLRAVTHVVNCAAIASFGHNPHIWKINVDATFAFARHMARMPALQRFLHVGTAMACGPTQAPIVSESWDMAATDQQLVQYTASKAAIEQRLRTELPELPLVVARPSIVVGHSRLGCIPSGSIFWIFRMVHLLEGFTCDLDQRIDVIPVDYCAEALTKLLLKETLAHDLYHVSAGVDASCTFAEIDVELARGLGGTPLGARFRRVVADDLPQLARDLEERIGACNKRLMLRALRLYGYFAELNYVFDNSRLLAEYIAPPRFSSYIGLCARTSAQIPIQQQMQWDFKTGA